MKDKKKEKKIEIATSDEVAAFGSGPADEQKGEDAETPAAEGTEPGAGAEASAGADATEAPTDAASETDLQRAERERDEFKDKWLRSKAEAQNQARRLRADRQEAVRYAVADFARSLLNVVDDLERSLEAAEKDASAAAVTEGVRIVYDHLLKVLGDHGVEKIEAVGQAFDPTCHEAMTQQPSSDHSPGTVLQQVQQGYRLHERVLRPARVIVSCEPPSVDSSGAEGAAADETPEDNEE